MREDKVLAPQRRVAPLVVKSKAAAVPPVVSHQLTVRCL